MFKYKATDSGYDLKIDFSSFKSENGNANLKANIYFSIDLNNLKTELEKALSFSSVGFTATAKVTMPDGNSFKPIEVVIEIDAGNNTFADDVKTAYKVKDKKATVEITIKRNDGDNWDGSETTETPAS